MFTTRAASIRLALSKLGNGHRAYRLNDNQKEMFGPTRCFECTSSKNTQLFGSQVTQQYNINSHGT